MATLPYGWNKDVPLTPSTQSPSGECHKWLSDFIWLQGAFAASGGSMGNNILTNGSFTTIPVSTSGWVAYDSAVYYTSGSGMAASSVQVSGGTTASGGIYQDFKVQPNTSYDFCMHYKCLAGSAGWILQEMDSTYMASSGRLVGKSNQLTDSGWTKLHQLFVTSASAASCRLRLVVGNGADANDVWFDEVVVSSNRGGHHRFPSSTPVGNHLPGQVSMVFVGGSAQVDAMADPYDGALAFDTNNYQFRYYDSASAAWRTVEDFISMERAQTISSNIVFETANGSVDGRKYRTDGTKLDGIQDQARHIILGSGRVAHGSPIPFPDDTYVHAASTAYSRNGSMEIESGEFWADGDQSAQEASAWVPSGSSCYIRLHSAGVAGSCAYVSAGSAGKYMYQDYAIAVSGGSADLRDFRLTYQYQPSSTVASIPQVSVYDLNNLSFIMSWSNLASSVSGAWNASAHNMVQPNGCTSMRVQFAASGAGQQVLWDSIEFTKWSGVPTTPASCESIRWMAGIAELETATDSNSFYLDPWNMTLDWYEDAAGGEIIGNGTFAEAPTSSWGTSGVSVSFQNGGVAGSSCTILATAASGYLYQSGSVVANNRYLFDFQYMIGGPDAQDMMFYQVTDLTNNEYIVAPTRCPSAASWRQISIDFLAPTGCASVKLAIGVAASAALASRVASVDSVSAHQTTGYHRKVHCAAWERTVCTCNVTFFEVGPPCTCFILCYEDSFGQGDVTGTANYLCVGVRQLT